MASESLEQAPAASTLQPPHSSGTADTPSDRSGTSTPTLSSPSAAVDNTPNDSSKLKAFLSVLKKFIGVTDLAAQRFSLPAQLLEPTPNLEYWQYIDRPEAFVSIGDSDDPLGRMLGALRFWFTKDLKYVKGKPCKPYNSTLGEFFRCNWDIEQTLPPVLGQAPPDTQTKSPIRLSYLTEQTSHHPPVSAYYLECPEKGISGRGFDQLSANFTGTRIRVQPGEYNKGIYINLGKHNDESYHLTHPIAHLGGFFKGSLNISVADSCSVTCPQTKLKAILVYQEEGWMGKAQNKMQGIIFKYDPENDDITKFKDILEEDIVARLEGSWHEQIYCSLGSQPFDKAEKILIIDVAPLWPAPKLIPPVDDQLPNESRKQWSAVTEAILSKQYSAANAAKQQIEERQRQKAADRQARNVEWKPRFFTGAVTPPGKPDLTDEGRAAIEKLHAGDYVLEPSSETAA